MTTLTERLDKLPPARRKSVEQRAKLLMAEEMSLQDLRKARKQTQVRVAEKLGINQENVSRIERRSDLLISTLSGYVKAMGGKLSPVAEFPDRPPIALTGITDLDKEDLTAKGLMGESLTFLLSPTWRYILTIVPSTRRAWQALNRTRLVDSCDEDRYIGVRDA